MIMEQGPSEKGSFACDKSLQLLFHRPQRSDRFEHRHERKKIRCGIMIPSMDIIQGVFSGDQSMPRIALPNCINRMIQHVCTHDQGVMYVLFRRIGPYHQWNIAGGKAVLNVRTGLLLRMDPEGAERIVEVRKIALFQDMEPHLEVNQLLVARVEPAAGVFFPEQDHGRFADVVLLLQKTSLDDFYTPLPSF